MLTLRFNVEGYMVDVSPETAALLGAIMSAISDTVKGVADAADGAVARANKKIADLETENATLKADAATPEDVNKLEGTKTVLDGLTPDSSVVVNQPENPPAGGPTTVL